MVGLGVCVAGCGIALDYVRGGAGGALRAATNDATARSPLSRVFDGVATLLPEPDFSPRIESFGNLGGRMQQLLRAINDLAEGVCGRLALVAPNQKRRHAFSLLNKRIHAAAVLSPSKAPGFVGHTL